MPSDASSQSTTSVVHRDDQPIPGIPSDSTSGTRTDVAHHSIFSDGGNSNSESDDNQDDVQSIADSSGADDGDLIRLANIQGRSVPQRHCKKQYSVVLMNKPKTHHVQRRQPQEAPKDKLHREHNNSSASKSNDVVKGNGSSDHIRASRRSDAKSSYSRRSTGLFVSRLAKATKPIHIEKHVQSETGLKVKCEALMTKYDSYTSFYVRVPYKDQSQLLISSLWPKGVIVRPFFE